jgi:hypothetical protein
MSSFDGSGLDNARSNNGILGVPEAPNAATEHINIKVTDNNNEIFFKIKRNTQLKKLMDAFCERQGKARNLVRFCFDGIRVLDQDTPNTVRSCVPTAQFS